MLNTNYYIVRADSFNSFISNSQHLTSYEFAAKFESHHDALDALEQFCSNTLSYGSYTLINYHEGMISSEEKRNTIENKDTIDFDKHFKQFKDTVDIAEGVFSMECYDAKIKLNKTIDIAWNEFKKTRGY